MTARGGSGSEMVIVWFASERRERRRKVRLDREHLEPRARRFLKIYLNADETRKPEFYRAVQEASEQCRPSGSSLPPLELEHAQVAEATPRAAMQIVLDGSALNNPLAMSSTSPRFTKPLSLRGRHSTLRRYGI